MGRPGMVGGAEEPAVQKRRSAWVTGVVVGKWQVVVPVFPSHRGHRWSHRPRQPSLHLRWHSAGVPLYSGAAWLSWI